MRNLRLRLITTLMVLVLSALTACTGETTSANDGPPVEVFWRLAQASLLPGQRIDQLTVTREAECQLSENTKASFGYVSEWVVEYAVNITHQDGKTSALNRRSVVAQKENGEWVQSGWPNGMCTDR